jgi:hypothetical protein
MSLYWRRSFARMQWELWLDDQVHRPQRVSYVTDEFLADAALPEDALRALLNERFPIPLPDEAFA